MRSPRPLLPLALVLTACSTSMVTAPDLSPPVDAGGDGAVEDGAGSAPDLAPDHWNGWWERIGPWNFYDDPSENGAAGTVADAVADPDAPGTYFIGGSNNGAASGVWKSTDQGKHWLPASSGLGDPRIFALRRLGSALFAGTPSGIFKSSDGAKSWALEPGTDHLGVVRYFVVDAGAAPGMLLAATDQGLAWTSNGSWQVSPAPGGSPGIYILSLRGTGGSATVYAVGAGSAVFRFTFDAGGKPLWASLPMRANTVSVDPSNPMHVLGTHPGEGTADDYAIIESTDGGMTAHTLARQQAWYVAFDPADATGKRVWCAGQGGALHSEDGGRTWTQTTWQTPSRDGYVHTTTGFDIQRIVFDFAGTVAFPSDQGLVRYAGNDVLESLCGDLRIGVVVSTSVSHAADGSTGVLTTMWDWGPTDSWDGGRTWPATTWYGSEYWFGDGSGAPIMGEGGQVFALAASADGKAHVFQHDGGSTTFWSDDGGHHFNAVPLPLDGAAQPTVLYNAFDYERSAAGLASGVLYLAAVADGHLRIYRSSDYGASWKIAKAPFAAPPAAVALAAEPGHPGSLWLGLGGSIQSSSDGGDSFALVAASAAGQIVRLAMRPDGGRLAALFDAPALVVRSADGSGFVQAGDATLAAALAAADPGTFQLAYSPSGKTLVFAGAGHRPGATRPYVLASHDDGATFTDATHDARTVQINGVAWDGADLYLATSGEAILRRRAFE